MGRSLEETLAFHCAPALVGLKPANLISCEEGQYPNQEGQFEEWNRKLNPKGLYFRTICQCGCRSLKLVYRLPILQRHLAEPKVAAFLKQAGYPLGDVEAVLSHMEQRLSEEEFPHEVGVILGYPVEDVIGFLKNQGRNCKFCGYWKVYTNEQETRILFQQYTNCREKLCGLIADGRSIVQLFSAA